MKNQFFLFFLAFYVGSVPLLSSAGELNFSGIFGSFGRSDVSQHREIEERIENDINNFRSIKSSRVVIPVEHSKAESLWGSSEARVLPVEVILKLKKRRRLTQDEFNSINNLLNSSLSNKNQMVQAVIRDEEGFEWSEASEQAKSYFKASSLEHEIWDRLKTMKEVSWASVHVSEADSSCRIFGNYEKIVDDPALQIRRNVMSAMGDLCTSSRLSIAAPKSILSRASASSPILWLEKFAYVLLGFALWGLIAALAKNMNPRTNEAKHGPATDAEDAIILTQMVDRSPDQAAKWMVRAMLSQKTPEKEEEKKKPQIFDQPL